MAEVWEGHDDLLARPVAVKIPLPHLAGEEAFVARFRREAIAAARLSHPNVVSIYDTGTDGEDSFIVMELVRGPTLREILAKEGPRSPGEAVAIASQVASALDFAHRAGIVHRDIKPANILVAEDGTAKVADFGIAKAGHDTTVTRATVGTARYLSPEQVEGTRPDGRSDVYSLGVVLYEMLCGRPPFEADNELALALKHVRAQVVPPSALVPSVPEWLEAVVMRALSKDPAERFQTAGEMRKVLIGGPGYAPGADRGSALPYLRGGETVRLPAAAGAADSPTVADRRFVASPSGSNPASQVRGGGTADGVLPVERGTRPEAGRGGRRALPWVAGIVALAAVGVGLFLALRLSGSTSSRHSPTAPTTAATSAVPITGAQLFDPNGDGTEDQSRIPNLIDNQASTAWTSEHYNSQTFGNLKPGLGFILQLQGSEQLNSLIAMSSTTGYNASVYVSDRTHPSIQGWGAPVANRSDVGPLTTFNLAGHRGSVVLFWVNRLGPDQMLKIGELRVTGSG